MVRWTWLDIIIAQPSQQMPITWLSWQPWTSLKVPSLQFRKARRPVCFAAAIRFARSLRLAEGTGIVNKSTPLLEDLRRQKQAAKDKAAKAKLSKKPSKDENSKIDLNLGKLNRTERRAATKAAREQAKTATIPNAVPSSSGPPADKHRVKDGKRDRVPAHQEVKPATSVAQPSTAVKEPPKRKRDKVPAPKVVSASNAIPPMSILPRGDQKVTATGPPVPVKDSTTDQRTPAKPLLAPSAIKPHPPLLRDPFADALQSTMMQMSSKPAAGSTNGARTSTAEPDSAPVTTAPSLARGRGKPSRGAMAGRGGVAGTGGKAETAAPSDSRKVSEQSDAPSSGRGGHGARGARGRGRAAAPRGAARGGAIAALPAP